MSIRPYIDKLIISIIRSWNGAISLVYQTQSLTKSERVLTENHGNDSPNGENRVTIMGKDKPNGLVAYESYCLYTLTLYSLYKKKVVWVLHAG